MFISYCKAALKQPVLYKALKVTWLVMPLWKIKLLKTSI